MSAHKALRAAKRSMPEYLAPGGVWGEGLAEGLARGLATAGRLGAVIVVRVGHGLHFACMQGEEGTQARLCVLLPLPCPARTARLACPPFR